MTDVLTPAALNRATLARQLLLERDERPIVDAVHDLVGLQAQVPLDPYLALWSRLAAFDADELCRRLVDRSLVRTVVMRGTIHLVTANDCLVLRPLVQPVLDQELARHRDVAPGLVGVDLEPVLDVARRVLAEEPRTTTQLRAALADHFPDLDASALGYACRNHLALVQVPPRGVWGQRGQVTLTTAETWLGRPVAEHPSLDDVVLRYFAAFGPATVADVSAWSRLTGLRVVVERLRPRLRPFVDERGRELFDLPDSPRPDPDTSAPVRILPEYDNVLLSHADRSRFVRYEHPANLGSQGTVNGTVLVDGDVRATWRLQTDRDDGSVTMHVDYVGRLSKRVQSSVVAEARRSLRFLKPDAPSHDVRLVALD